MASMAPSVRLWFTGWNGVTGAKDGELALGILPRILQDEAYLCAEQAGMAPHALLPASRSLLFSGLDALWFALCMLDTPAFRWPDLMPGKAKEASALLAAKMLTWWPVILRNERRFVIFNGEQYKWPYWGLNFIGYCAGALGPLNVTPQQVRLLGAEGFAEKVRTLIAPYVPASGSWVE